MVGKVSQFTLQAMANTNHKFPMMGGGHGYSCKSQFTSTESVVLAQSLRVYDEYRNMMMENTSSARCRALAIGTTDVGCRDLVLLDYKMFFA